MKRFIQFTLLLFLSNALMSQSTIEVKINHFLNSESFEFNKKVENNLGESFNLKRLEYYLSGFQITHDGGQVINLDSKYFLVNANNGSDTETYSVLNLGELDITNIENISFHIGIDEETNHGDPALYPVTHPLGPKSPSMHWGWAAGYRFIALEGKSGSNLNQALEFHTVGDRFYHKVEFPINEEIVDNTTYTLSLDAEYVHLLNDISISGGILIHGDLDEIVPFMANMQTDVFTKSIVSNVIDEENIKEFNVYPNPSSTGEINVDVQLSHSEVQNVIITDILGKHVYRTTDKNERIFLKEKGLYFISVMDNNGNQSSARKVIIQ